jgi:two-component system nitrate/nitrite response regulator NarL
LQNFSIHVCDDHPLITSGLEQIFIEIDFITDFTSSYSSEGLFSFLRNNKVDLLLLDISLKGQNSMDDLPFILLTYPAMKVVLISTYDLMDIQLKARDFGAHGFISKSSNNSHLIDICKRVMDGEDFWNIDALTSFNLVETKGLDIDLTVREVEIVKLLLKGNTNQKIANQLNISIHTVQTHRKNIKSKLQLEGVSDLITFANRFKLV